MTEITQTIEAPTPAPTPSMPPLRVAAYIFAAMVIAIGAGLGQGFVTANLPQIAGDLGITTTEASWLVVAYIIPRCCLPLMLVKLRSQYGLRRFTEVAIATYVVVSLASFWMQDLRSAIVIQLLAGSASASLSTLGFLYIMEPLSQRFKMVVGMPLALTCMTIGPSMARVIAPSLIGDGGLLRIHLMSLGLALIAMAFVMRLPLTPIPRAKVLRLLDFASFSLISLGFSGVIIAFVMGPLRWWTEMPWLGALLAVSIAALALVVIIELWRKEPLLDIRWLASPEILHLSATLLLFRIILSEQSAGAPRMFQILGVAPSQMVTLFTVICLGTAIGGLACFAWMRPGKIARLHLVALLLIAFGAWMDSHSTIDTRPEQMLISQGLIAVAGVLFMAPAMMTGLMTALKRGPQYILSFIIVFISTQSIGGMLGSGAFMTLINHRQAFHYKVLQEELTLANGPMMADLAAKMAALGSQFTDPSVLKAQAMAQIGADATMQSYVLAYNDAYLLTCLIALFAAGFLCLHVLRDWLMARFELKRASLNPA